MDRLIQFEAIATIKEQYERSDVVPVLVEIFADYGYEGASLSIIGERTGLGSSSLYHFFRRGKKEMAAAALEYADEWFRMEILEPLSTSKSVQTGLERMLSAIKRHANQTGGNLAALFALSRTRDTFADQVDGHFTNWASVLTKHIMQAGYSRGRAWAIAEEMIGTIEGARVLSRARNDPRAFGRALKRLKTRIQGLRGKTKS